MAMGPGYNPHYRFDKTSDTERRISVKPNTTNNENTMFPKALADAITATQQSGLPPVEFIRRLCGALGLGEEDLKKKTQNMVGEVCSHKAGSEVVAAEYQLLPMSLLAIEVLYQYDLPGSIHKYLHVNDRGVLLLQCKKSTNGKWVPVLMKE